MDIEYYRAQAEDNLKATTFIHELPPNIQQRIMKKLIYLVSEYYNSLTDTKIILPNFIRNPVVYMAYPKFIRQKKIQTVKKEQVC